MHWSKRNIESLIGLALVLVASFFTHFYRYQDPAAFFWDENYHVASAQKYLTGVFFMEPHPPFGKLLIALGEWLVDANPQDNQFIGTDHAKGLPENFSFAGFRLFPALMSWLTAPALFLVFLRLTRHPRWSVLLSGLYIFDTALIVHGRGAMLESPQLFWISLSILAFLQMLRRQSAPLLYLWSAILGGAFGLVVATKINGLILLPLLPLALVLAPGSVETRSKALMPLLASLAIFYVIPWAVHFKLGQRIEPKLPDNGYYQASAELKSLFIEGSATSLSAFPVQLRDAYHFVGHYQRGVPNLNLCKHEENGSPAWWWPLGGRSINYRWEKKDGKTGYLYLQINPAAWAIGLLGVLGCSALLLAQLVSKPQRKLKQPLLMASFLLLYVGYMGTMLLLTRVMYLYHYFIPLVLSFILFALFMMEVRSLGLWRASRVVKTSILALAILVTGACYAFFRPLAYAHPLTDKELAARAWLGLWDLHCVNCDLTNHIAAPICDPKVKENPTVEISGVRAIWGYQEWGEPKQNVTVENQPLTIRGEIASSGIGVHASSTLRFPLGGRFTHFSGGAGLPDAVRSKTGAPASVQFEIVGDGKQLWKSVVMTPDSETAIFDLDVAGVSSLELLVKDGGDGINNDHAIWVNLLLR